MKILLIGYGKMGKTIEKIALERGHQIVEIIDQDQGDKFNHLDTSQIDVAIEFTQPEAAVANIKQCLDQGIPVISGTTGWLEQMKVVEDHCQQRDGTFFYASNFSLGVNIFFKLNEYLASLMQHFTEYDVKLEEIHHTEKKDAPSGTAISLAEGILKQLKRKKQWIKEVSEDPTNLVIGSLRQPEVPGTHIVNYFSLNDDIEIKHTAHSRQGFASGVVLVAEWILDKKGILSMDDFLPLK
ncbi:MAG: 4-hydroxy-tetrahydrodipicolinate reductase [Candidatus Cyclobacteriaceae bacterium M3_2C_046]